MYVNSDHAGGKETQISGTGFLIYMNKALVQWLLKKQPVIEASVFGFKFVARKIGIEPLRGFRYKLSMMAIPLSYPLLTYGHNMPVIQNTYRLESKLRKKSNSDCYNAI